MRDHAPESLLSAEIRRSNLAYLGCTFAKRCKSTKRSFEAGFFVLRSKVAQYPKNLQTHAHP